MGMNRQQFAFEAAMPEPEKTGDKSVKKETVKVVKTKKVRKARPILHGELLAYCSICRKPFNYDSHCKHLGAQHRTAYRRTEELIFEAGRKFLSKHIPSPQYVFRFVVRGDMCFKDPDMARNDVWRLARESRSKIDWEKIFKTVLSFTLALFSVFCFMKFIDTVGIVGSVAWNHMNEGVRFFKIFSIVAYLVASAVSLISCCFNAPHEEINSFFGRIGNFFGKVGDNFKNKPVVWSIVVTSLLILFMVFLET